MRTGHPRICATLNRQRFNATSAASVDRDDAGLIGARDSLLAHVYVLETRTRTRLAVVWIGRPGICTLDTAMDRPPIDVTSPRVANLDPMLTLWSNSPYSATGQIIGQIIGQITGQITDDTVDWGLSGDPRPIGRRLEAGPAACVWRRPTRAGSPRAGKAPRARPQARLDPEHLKPDPKPRHPKPRHPKTRHPNT